MPVVGIALNQINGNRTDDYAGQVKINNKTNLKEIKETTLPGINRKGLNMKFEFDVGYITDKEKEFARILITGNVLFVDEDLEKIVEEWKKSKKLPEEINLQVLNSIFRKCMIKALSISEELQLPPPMALPVIAAKKD